MILKPINNLEEFCSKAEPAIGVFASSRWLSVYDGNDLKLVGIYKDDHQLIGGFYYLLTKRAGFKFIKLPPYTPHCALFFEGEGKNVSSRNNFSKEVMTAVAEYISAQKAALNILAFPYSITDLQPFIWTKYKTIPNYTYLVRLEKSLEEIRSNFDSKHRNAINKAVKEGVEVSVFSGDRNVVYDFFRQSLTGSGANVYDPELKNILTRFSEPDNSFTLQAFQNGKLLGMVHCIYDAQTCYYLLGGVDKNSGVQGVNNLLVLKSIEKAKELGCRIFDFEGSMLKGVEKFFRGFGPELVPYFTINKASVFLEILLKFYKRNIF